MTSKRILYIQYTNPSAYPPLEHSSRLLAAEGWQVLFLGISMSGMDNLKFPFHPNITVKQLPFCPPGWRQKVHYFWFCLWTIFWTIRWRPQWLYISDLLACLVSMPLSFFPRLRLIYHEHDSPNTVRKSIFLKLCLAARNQLVPRVAFCILPNQKRAHIFDKVVGNPSTSLCVWNCPSLEEVSPIRLPWERKVLWVLFHGSIVPDRLPLTVLHALSKLPDCVNLRVIGYQTIGYPNYLQELKETAENLNIIDRIDFINAVPRRKLLAWCQQSDVGLAFMPSSTEDINMNYMVGASNKPFDYLACGVPMLVSDLPDWNQLYVEPGYGLAVNPEDSWSIANGLQWYLSHPDKIREMGEMGRKRIIEEWNYEKQFSSVFNRMRNKL
jgi:glycosyltransferase involved in cell wall biosynthesis